MLSPPVSGDGVDGEEPGCTGLSPRLPDLRRCESCSAKLSPSVEPLYRIIRLVTWCAQLGENAPFAARRIRCWYSNLMMCDGTKAEMRHPHPQLEAVEAVVVLHFHRNRQDLA